MTKKVAKRVVIKEDTGGFCGVQYFTTLVIKKNSISYKERTENHIQSMFYADRDYSYKYKIESSLFEYRFNELVRAIESVDEALKTGKIPMMHCTDVGINEMIVEYEDGTKLNIEFYLGLYENQFNEVADIIRSMIPSCEQISEYLMTDEELEAMNNPDGVEEDE